MLSNQEIVALLKKKISGRANSQDLKKIDLWVGDSPARGRVLKNIEEGNCLEEDLLSWISIRQEKQNVEGKVWNRIRRQENLVRKKAMAIKIICFTSAAALLVFVGVLFSAKDKQFNQNEQVDPTPGGSRAVLKIEGGDEIQLDELQKGLVFGNELTYSDGTRIGLADYSENVLCELTTPKGGTYSVLLSDGTRVKLNADSKLTYPLNFANSNREVTLVGEGFFEVKEQRSSGDRLPFVINTPFQRVEVLGTSFNINAYKEVTDSRITLVTGTVMVEGKENKVLLKKDEQSFIENGRLRKHKVDVNHFISWINDEFVFYETPLYDALKELSRWYCFEMPSRKDLPDTHLYGSINRNEKFSSVLELLNSTGLKFKVEKFSGKHHLVIN